jgi:hypothetical protein
MLSPQETLELCLQISGSFENGDPAYDAITGNFDGMGISVGILQWNAGAGSLSTLIRQAAQCSSAEAVNAFFSNGEDVASLARMGAAESLRFCIAAFLPDGKNLSPQAVMDWQSFLQSDASVQAQLQLATNGVLAKANSLAEQFSRTMNMRDISFFFDVATQSGGMSNSRGSVVPLVEGAPNTYEAAIQMAQIKSSKTAQYWTQTCQMDEQARHLLHYAYQRALLSRPEYVWDALSRRGAIACRGGVVHGSWFDFTDLLP